MSAPSQSESMERSVAEAPILYLWDDSYHLTQAILNWSARPSISPLQAVFRDELVRRKGLRAYGVRLPVQRRSPINQIHSHGVLDFAPRQLSDRVSVSEPAHDFENLPIAEDSAA